GKASGVGDRAASRTRHPLLRGNALLDERVGQPHALLDRERVRLAVGAEYRKAAAAVREQPLAVAHVARGIGGQVVLERGDDRREHALESHGPWERWREPRNYSYCA